MKGTRLSLSKEWVIGERIGGGGFGEVWEAVSGDEAAAIKFIPKAPGAERELLFVDLAGTRKRGPGSRPG
jgi:eukaryotic-like serine/threonine-protein kinase